MPALSRLNQQETKKNASPGLGEAEWLLQAHLSVELALLPFRASPSNPDMCAAGKCSCRSLWNTTCGVRSDRYK